MRDAFAPSLDVRPARRSVQARLIVFGRQGAGKGTQCIRLARALDITHISTGDAIRAAVAKRTELGRQAETAVASGRLLGDDLVTAVVASQIENLDGRGFVLDGFPRTVGQAEALAQLLTPGHIDLAVNLAVDRSTAMQRLLGRRVCATCGRPASPTTERCRCGGPLVQRADDTAVAIQRRLDAYERETVPVLAWYAARGLLSTIDGRGPASVVADQLRQVVCRRLRQREPSSAL